MSTDRGLFSNWIFVNQLENAFKEPEIAGNNIWPGEYHSTVSYFIDKDKKILLLLLGEVKKKMKLFMAIDSFLMKEILKKGQQNTR